MALTNDEKVVLKEIVGISDDTELTFLLKTIDNSDLVAETYTKMSDDIGKWREIEDDTVRVKGGKNAVDVDEERTRSRIRSRLMIHLRLTNQSGMSGITTLVRA